MYAPYIPNTNSRTPSLAVRSVENFAGFDLQVGNDDQSTRGNSSYSRALVKDHDGGVPKLVVNYGGDFPNGVEVHGKGLRVNGDLSVRGANVFPNNWDFVIGSGNQTERGDSGLSRALVKDHDGGVPKLVVNYGGDFKNGVHVHGKEMKLDGNLIVKDRNILEELDAIKAQLGM